MSLLPKIEHPTFEIEVPSSKEKVRVRPMLVKEEKILLTAKEGNAPNETYVAIHSVVNNCLVSQDVNLKKLTSFDIEYLFLRVRAVSIGNIVDLAFNDDEDDGKEHSVKINLDKVEVKFPRGEGKDAFDIKMGVDKGIIMKYPAASVYESKVFTNPESSEEQLITALVIASLEKYYNGEKIVQFRDCPPEEVTEFVDNLDIKTYGAIRNFISEFPTLFYEVKYKNSKGEDKTIELKSLADFFVF